MKYGGMKYGGMKYGGMKYGGMKYGGIWLLLVGTVNMNIFSLIFLIVTVSLLIFLATCSKIFSL
jgi:hypothetical protein